MIFLIAGGLITMQSFKNYQVLNQEGLITTAYIIDLEVDNSGDSTDYFVRYQYTVPWNQELTSFTNNESVSKGLFDSYTLEQPVEIIYAPSEPHIASLTSKFAPPNQTMIVMGAIFIFIFLITGIGMTAAGIRSIFLGKKLREHGVKTEALIFDRWKDHNTDGTIECIAYGFEARNRFGQSEIFTRAERNRKIYKDYQIGHSIPVIYLPDDPKINKISVQ